MKSGAADCCGSRDVTVRVERAVRLRRGTGMLRDITGRTFCIAGLAVALGGAAGCGAAPEPRAEPAAPTLEYSGWCAQNPPPEFTGEAVDTHGADAVTAAYCTMADFTMNVATWNPTLLRAEAQTLEPAEIAFLKPYMTPTMQNTFDEWVQKANREEERGEYSKSVLLLCYTGFTGSDGAPATWPTDDADLVTGKELTDPVVELDIAEDGTQRLAVTLTAAGVLHPTIDGVAYDWTSEKTITYRLVAGDNPGTWLIDDVEGRWHGNGVAAGTS
jgi:hypothetical protein